MKRGTPFLGKRRAGNTLFEFLTHSPEETQELGKRIGQLNQPGDIILLVGGLGSGKTCLTQGIAWGLGIKEYALSPSFVIIREYKGRLPLYHIDFYRLGRVEEIEDLGLDDYLYGDGVVVVEWAEKGMGLWPPQHLLININFVSEWERRFHFYPQGKRYEEVIQGLRQWNWQ